MIALQSQVQAIDAGTGQIDDKTSLAQALAQIVTGLDFILDEQDFHGHSSISRPQCAGFFCQRHEDDRIVIKPSLSCQGAPARIDRMFSGKTLMLRFRAGLLLAFLLVPTAALPSEVLEARLDVLLDYARSHNPTLAGAHLEAEAAGERANAAGTLPDPRLRLEWMDLTRGDSRNPSLLPGRVGQMRYGLMQTLPWPGTRGLERGTAEAQASASANAATSTWNDLVAAIKTRHAQLYFLERDAGLIDEILTLIAQLEDSARHRYAVGLAAQQDVIRAQLEQTRLRNRQITLADERHRLHSELNVLLGRPAQAGLLAPTRIDALPPAEQLDPEALAQRLHQNNPQLHRDAALVRAAESQRERTRRERYPDISIGLTPVQHEHAIDEWELMLEFSIPLQRKARRARERESEIRLAAAQVQREDRLQQLSGELDTRLARLASSRQSLELIETRLLPQAELTLESARIGYAAGQVDFATVLDAQEQILQARLEQNQTALAAHVQLAEIERLLGAKP